MTRYGSGPGRPRAPVASTALIAARAPVASPAPRSGPEGGALCHPHPGRAVRALG